LVVVASNTPAAGSLSPAAGTDGTATTVGITRAASSAATTTHVAIVAHTARAPMAEALAAAVNADWVSIDDGRLGAEGNHHAVWAWHTANPAAWHVTLEDDCLPVDGFRDQLAQALAVAPTPIVSLYLGRQRPAWWQQRIGAAIKQAEQEDARWIVSTDLLHAVGVAIRGDLIADMPALHNLPVDEALNCWAHQTGHRIAYTVPSLIDHLDGPTVINHQDGDPRPPGRIAWQTGTAVAWDGSWVAM
jgi:hypothetical protein